MAITGREADQVAKANRSGKAPVVFIHGLWLLPSSWDRWASVFEKNGYAAVQASWPDDPETVEQARATPEVFAKKSITQVVDHVSELIEALDGKPVVVGHSFGGLFTQILAGRGLAAASVAIDPAPFRGVLQLPLSTLRSAGPVLSNPLNRGRAVTLTLDQFRYGWANALGDEEAARIYEEFHVAGPGSVLFEGATANLNPFTAAKVDTNSPDRGPLLLISGDEDRTVPWALVNAEYKKQRHNDAVTEAEKVPGRGHSLTVDSGWSEVAERALAFLKKES